RVAKPLGMTAAGQAIVDDVPRGPTLALAPSFLKPSLGAQILAPRGISYEALVERRAIAYYVSHAPPWERHVTQIDLMLRRDPVSREGIADLDRIEAFLHGNLPGELGNAQLRSSGSTAMVRDFATVKRDDEQRIELLVPAIVFVLLLVLLRRATISIYLRSEE